MDKEFNLVTGGPSLASLRDLPRWKTCAQNASAALLADTSQVTERPRAGVKLIIDAHYTHGMSLAARVAKFPIVVEGDVSTPAIHAYFLSLISKGEQSALKTDPT